MCVCVCVYVWVCVCVGVCVGGVGVRVRACVARVLQRGNVHHASQSVLKLLPWLCSNFGIQQSTKKCATKS